jgi:penicillin-binding protein 1A
MPFFSWLLRFIFAGGFLAVFVVFALLSGFTLFFGPKLPLIESVRDLQLQTPLRIYSADGKLLGEFGETRRQPLAYADIPPMFVNAVLAAEDDRFFSHNGVDATGLLRAGSELVKTGRIRSGGSTITMQLARNFFLSTEQSFTRKFNEILLSLQLEKTLKKEEIFELYANKIFLGNRAYGVQTAAFVYYGKSLQELSLAQWAMLAGLPKAPSKYNPLVNLERSMIRRNWIIGRMLKLGAIDQAAHDAALAEPETAQYHGLQTDINSPFIAEMARQFAVEKFGDSAYTGGYSVFTTADSRLLLAAQQAVWQGAVAYDQRHGYRGPEKHHTPPDNPQDSAAWKRLLADASKVGNLEPAIVTSINKTTLHAQLKDSLNAELHWHESTAMQLRPYKTVDYLGASPTGFSSVFKPGDIIRVKKNTDNSWEIGQIPRAEAALVSLDSDTGAILALSGGTDFNRSKFNRVTQALRQPGSNFKPFFYAKALEDGYTPATLINDAPLVFQEAGMQEAWRPANSGDEYNGPTRLRTALYQSRNMVSIRILQHLGVPETIKSLPRFGFNTAGMQPNLSLALGSHAFTPLTIANAYAVLANGGYKVEAFLVKRIDDAQGHIVYEHTPMTVCRGCDGDNGGQLNPAPRVVDEQTAFIIDDILKDVVLKGTARQALELNRPDIAGKTGTTNGPTDAWFSGYNPAIVTTAWMGFDDNSLLGKREYGGTAALPIWIDYMREALRDKPVIERPMPTGLALMKIDPDTGQRAAPDRTDAVFEIFRIDPASASELSSDTDQLLDGDALPAGASANSTPLTEDLF